MMASLSRFRLCCRCQISSESLTPVISAGSNCPAWCEARRKLIALENHNWDAASSKQAMIVDVAMLRQFWTFIQLLTRGTHLAHSPDRSIQMRLDHSVSRPKLDVYVYKDMQDIV